MFKGKYICLYNLLRLYDGDSKTNVEDAIVELSSHRLLVRSLNMVLSLARVQGVTQVRRLTKLSIIL